MVFEDEGSNIYAEDIKENQVSSLKFNDKDIGSTWAYYIETKCKVDLDVVEK